MGIYLHILINLHKLGNMHVTNTHYTHEAKYPVTLFEKGPVTSKLADFGKGRSELAQTKKITF